ncbi:MAG: ROK family transcriptional regulator [Sulfobacillus sp.]
MRGTQPQTIRSLNLVSALDLVRRRTSISRAELARELRLSPPTSSELVSVLLQSGLVVEHGPGESQGGRKPMMIEFSPSLGHVLGVDIGSERIVFAIADLNGAIESETVIATPNAHDDILMAIQDTGRALIDSVSGPVIGAGLGVPGYCNRALGRVIWASNLPGWTDLDLGPLLQRQWACPVVMDNDANLAARGELAYGAAGDYRNFVFVALGRGVGAGVVIDQTIYRGRREMAGEIGTWNLAQPWQATLEGVVGGIQWKSLAQELVGIPDVGLLFRGFRDGRQDIQDAVQERVGALCVTLGNIVALLDPEALIFGGGLTAAWDVIGPLIEQALADTAFQVPIVVSTLPQRATVVGALADALESFAHSRHLLAGVDN